MKKAFITGVTGQDGSYLAEFLLSKGYKVYGMYRRNSVDGHHGRIAHLGGKIELVCGDLIDGYSLNKLIKSIMPDEVYNLAAQSQVRISFDQPFLTKETNWFGVERLLDVIMEHIPNVKFYQASTSELFGKATESPQNEQTPFNAVSPYAKSKEKAHFSVLEARKKGLFACCGILFNHESPRRGIEFVTRKLTDGMVRIKLGIPQRETGSNFLEIGNLEATRDWGYAKDYVEAMWLMLQQDKPGDYVVATGESHSVREFIEVASNHLGIKINWEGKDSAEVGFDQNGNKVIAINPKFFRPVEVKQLIGDPTQARRILNWSPKVKFGELVKMMVEADFKKISSDSIRLSCPKCNQTLNGTENFCPQCGLRSKN